jgi:hypothetical protein
VIDRNRVQTFLVPPQRSHRSSHRRLLRRILKRKGAGALAETPQRGLLGQFQVPTICIGQSHLFWCATIRFEHHRGGDENTEASGAGSGDQTAAAVGPVRALVASAEQFGLAGPPGTRLGEAKTASIQELDSA